jgi:hypothetical protein
MLVAYLGTAITRNEHVEAFDVAMNDADQGIMQILQGRGNFANGPDTFMRGRRRDTSQSVKPISTGHPFHNDEGVREVQACRDNLYAVGMADLLEVRKSDKAHDDKS